MKKDKTWERIEMRRVVKEEGKLDLSHDYEYGGNRFGNTSSTGISTFFSQLNKELADEGLLQTEKINDYLHTALGDKETGTLVEELSDVVESEYYHRNYAGINKKSKLSEEIYINRKLESLADKLITSSNNEEYPVMSKYAEDMNAKREMLINDAEDDDGRILSKLHPDIVELFNNEHTLGLINNYKLSEEDKRKLRNKNVTIEDLENHPEMMTMYLAAMTLENELGLSEQFTEEENLKKYITYIEKYNEMLIREKNKAFSRWSKGKSRLDDEKMKEYKENPYKFEYLFVNSVWRPLTEESELEEKWNEVLRFYGNANNPVSQYNKAKRIKNEITYEIGYMKQRLEPPVGFRGQKVTEYDVRLDQKELEAKFTFGDSKMIEGLLQIYNKPSPPIKDENGKSIRYKYAIPLFQGLEDKHEGHNTYIGHHIIGEFRRLWAATNLADYENTIVDLIVNRTHTKEKGESREDFYQHIMSTLNNRYNFEVHNERQLKTLIRKLSKKISNTYLDEIEINTLGLVKCSKCNKDKVASPRNFGNNKNNTGRKGLRSTCRECDNI
ncbi:hypothetical protein [Virgibacillus halodenitrificans]|uniref:Uncharacterized protein n=1 Tax=Virgibacillus halodenitrificans TaxID=1482 RepID=A0ABR7VLI6_VIRHA|nr:hypothetical protein [Virgibacillus halodenitrificans]MBD1222780.1 hypothetical protein [Virgibacillus halodenitrificans]